MTMKRAAVFALCFAASACSNYEGQGEPAVEPTPKAPPATSASGPSPLDETGPVTLEARVEMPAGLDVANITSGECMNPVDYINGAPATSGPYPAGGPAKVVGWNVISWPENPTPEVIYGVFKPYDRSQNGALLNGVRTARPDVAGDNKQYAMAGFELEGNFPAAEGRYRFYVWTGTADRMVECDSKIVINVR